MSITAQNVSQDSPLTPEAKSVPQKLNAPMVNNSDKDHATQSAMQVSTSTKESASTEDASTDTLLMPSEVVLDHPPPNPQAPTATSTSTTKTESV